MEKQSMDAKQVGAKIRLWREACGFSLRELSARSGIAASFLSRIEAGKGSPTVMTLQRILEALNTDVAGFFRNESSGDPAKAVVFPRKEMKALVEVDRLWVMAFPSHPSIGVKMSYEEYKPHTVIVEEERHSADLYGMVMDGELTLELPGRGIYKARKGDAFFLEANTVHITRNEGEKTLHLVVVRTQPAASQQTSSTNAQTASGTNGMAARDARAQSTQS